MTDKTYRQMNRHEREVFNAFYGGVCCTLSAAIYGATGTETEYLEVVSAVGADELLNFARRNDDMELPNIRRAIRHMREQDEAHERFEKFKASKKSAEANP